MARQASDQQNLSSAIDAIKGIIKSQNTGWTLLSILCTGLFCGPLITFSPLIVKDVLHADVAQFGSVLTAFGVGGMLGPILILLATQRLDPMRMSLTAALIYGLFIVAASQVGAVWQLALLLVGSGFLLTVANTSANTFLQSQANDQNRGQTASLFMLAMRGGLSLGNLATGMLISLSSVHLAFIMNGLLAMVTSKVLHDSNCAIWTTPHAEDLAMTQQHWPCRNVVVAVDRGPEQTVVLRRAVELARELGARVRLVHAVPGAEHQPGDPGGDEFAHFLMQMAAKDMAQLQAAVGTNFEASVVAGGIGPVVHQAAEAQHADLVVIGRGLMHETLGRLRSKSFEIIRQSPCPVLSL